MIHAMFPGRAAPAPTGVYGDTFADASNIPLVPAAGQRFATGPNGGWEWDGEVQSGQSELTLQTPEVDAVNDVVDTKRPGGTTTNYYGKWWTPDLTGVDMFVEATLVSPTNARGFWGPAILVNPADADNQLRCFFFVCQAANLIRLIQGPTSNRGDITGTDGDLIRLRYATATDTVTLENVTTPDSVTFVGPTPPFKTGTRAGIGMFDRYERQGWFTNFRAGLGDGT